MRNGQVALNAAHVNYCVVFAFQFGFVASQVVLEHVSQQNVG